MLRILLIPALLLVLYPAGSMAATEDPVLRAREGSANLLRGNFKDAVASFDAALKAPDIAEVQRANILNDRGVAKWRLKQVKEAIEDFNKSVSLFPDYAIVYNNRGNALMDMGEPAQASLDFTRAIELAPGYGAAYNNRGNALLMMGRKEEALRDFRKAVKLMPTNAVPFNGRGKAHASLGRPFAGVRDFSRALTLNARYAGARLNRGKALLALHRDIEAVEDYTSLIALRPEDASLYLARGKAYARTRRYNAANNDLTKAIDLDPTVGESYRERGSIFLAVNKPAQARDDLTIALTLDPDDVDALIQLAKVQLRSGETEDALASIDSAITAASDNAEALSTRGDIYLALQRPEDAANDFTQALMKDPGQVAARQNLARLGVAAPNPPQREYLGDPVGGWQVSRGDEGHYIATNRRFPSLRIRLEMYGDGVPKILEWTQMKYSLQGIALLRYSAGSTSEGGGDQVYTVIVDLFKSKVVSVEPYSWGKRESTWEWKLASVTVTDPDGVANEITLRTAPQDGFGQGDQHWFNDGWWSQQWSNPQPRPQPRRRQAPSGGGLFDWLFR